MPGIPSKRLLFRLLTIVMVVFLLIGAWLYNRQDKEYPAIPDETTAGLELLYRKFSGPGYFHLDGSTSELEHLIDRIANAPESRAVGVMKSIAPPSVLAP